MKEIEQHAWVELQLHLKSVKFNLCDCTLDRKKNQQYIA
jgi:hypothetical protein